MLLFFVILSLVDNAKFGCRLKLFVLKFPKCLMSEEINSDEHCTLIFIQEMDTTFGSFHWILKNCG